MATMYRIYTGRDDWTGKRGPQDARITFTDGEAVISDERTARRQGRDKRWTLVPLIDIFRDEYHYVVERVGGEATESRKPSAVVPA